MRIQIISNNYQLQNRNSNLNFKGELGNNILHGLSTRAGVHKVLIPSVIKIYGGFLKKFSKSEMKDILETFVDKINNDASVIEQLNNNIRDLKLTISEKEKEIKALGLKMENQQQEIAKKRQELEAVELQQQSYEKNLSDQKTKLDTKDAELDQRQNLLDAKEKELKAFEDKLTKLEQKIINETRNNTIETLRKEAKGNALDELGEKYLALVRQEAALKEKEQALINTENILKEAEVEKIQSDLRAYYNINEPNMVTYSNFGEQIVNVTQILNKNSRNLKGISASTPANLIKLLLDEDGKITRDKLNCLERIIGTGKLYDTQDLADAIDIVMKISNNLEDKDKAAHFITLLTMNNVSFVSAIKSFASHYNVKTVYDNIEDGKIKNLVNKMQEDQRSCGLNAYGYRPNIKTAESLYNDFDKIENLSLYSLGELKEALRATEQLINSETHRIPAENFRKMTSKLQQAIEDRKQI